MLSENLKLTIDTKSRDTEVTLGCDDCRFGRTLKFPFSALAMLSGIDTSGLPLKTQEVVQITITPDEFPSLQKGTINATSRMSIEGFICEPISCTYSDKIVEISEKLIERSHNTFDNNGQ